MVLPSSTVANTAASSSVPTNCLAAGVWIPAGVPSVEYPASSPFAVAVGGTTVTGGLPVPGVYTSEVTWYGGGGGLSYFESKPPYQSSPVPARRGVPDVALDADPTAGYQVIVSGQQVIIGGTSASAPAWNGYWAAGTLARPGRRLTQLFEDPVPSSVTFSCSLVSS